VLLVTACNPASKENNHTIQIYYDADYALDKTVFNTFKNYELVFTPYSFKTNIAKDIISKRQSKDFYEIYLINQSLLHDIHGVKNYKIKGLSTLSRRISVITTHNFSIINLEKVIRHEFGHGIGLSHCMHKLCIMNDAKGKFINLKNCDEFKDDCKKFMLEKSKLLIK
jgi:predicted Zn-dependent protease